VASGNKVEPFIPIGLLMILAGKLPDPASKTRDILIIPISGLWGENAVFNRESVNVRGEDRPVWVYRGPIVFGLTKDDIPRTAMLPGDFVRAYDSISKEVASSVVLDKTSESIEDPPTPTESV
jgi:hypothetical protein